MLLKIKYKILRIKWLNGKENTTETKISILEAKSKQNII